MDLILELISIWWSTNYSSPFLDKLLRNETQLLNAKKFRISIKTTIITDEELEMMAEYARSSQTESTFLQKLNKNAKKEKEQVIFPFSQQEVMADDTTPR